NSHYLTLAACGNGVCDAGESGRACPTDCCDSTTPCSALNAGTSGAGSLYCRSMSTNNGASWFPGPRPGLAGSGYGWWMASEATCQSTSFPVCVSRTRCDAVEY